MKDPDWNCKSQSVHSSWEFDAERSAPRSGVAQLSDMMKVESRGFLYQHSSIHGGVALGVCSSLARGVGEKGSGNVIVFLFLNMTCSHDREVHLETSHHGTG